jgi:NADPH-dependent glutamate synthase beta subunit-like oxidoreductase
MKNFKHEKAASFEEASALLNESPQNVVMSGGTDLLGQLKDSILVNYPEKVIDLKHIPGADGITKDSEKITIGALTKLVDIAQSDTINENIPMLAEAAKSVATPLIRNMGTIGGNICQDVRCWFYRYPHEAGGRLVCSRKGGDTCYALQGDNRYHSIFGGMKAHRTPCSGECPAGTDIPAYMEQLRQGNTAGAAQIIMRVNPMPALTSRVCAHFCQEKCNRNLNDESVAVGNVERFVGDYILDHAEMFYTAPDESTGKSVAVIGSGPAGLSAAFYLRQAGNNVTVYETKKEPGGMLMYAIPAYRLPKDLVRKFTGCLKGMGIDFVLNTTVGKDIQPADLEKQYDSVFYATGAWKRPVIGIAGEELTEFGLDFLVQVNEWMKGKVGSEVLVTGGGNVAMDVAVTAKRLGAKKVTMACLEAENEMPASKEEIARAREEGVIIMPSWGLGKVIEEDGKVKGMELKRCTCTRDENGRFDPQYDECETIVVNAENILMAVGQKVDLSFLDEKYQLQLNQRGLIDISEETRMTSREGVFAGGDVTTGPATVIKAIANGHAAAIGMNHYLGVLNEHNCRSMQSDCSDFLTFDPTGAQKATASKLSEIPADERSLDKEDAISLTDKAALEEANRCLNCGCYAVNPSDISPVLVALDAEILTTMRTVKASEFCCGNLKVSDALNKGEIVIGIQIPLIEGATMHYDKFRLRDAIDFAIVSVTSMYSVEKDRFTGARIVLGGVAPVPIRMQKVEGFLLGKNVTEAVADEAAEIAVKDTIPMAHNVYKVQELKALIKKSILRMQN